MAGTGAVEPLHHGLGPAVVEVDGNGVIVVATESLATMLGSPLDTNYVRTAPVGRVLRELLAPGEAATLDALELKAGQQPLAGFRALLVGRRDDGLPLVIRATIPEWGWEPDRTTYVMERWGGPVAWAQGSALEPPVRDGPDHVLSHDVRATIRNGRNFVNLFARKLAVAEPPAPELPASHLDTALRALATGDLTLDRIVWFMRLEHDPLAMQAIPLATLVEIARRQASADLAELAEADGQGDLAAPLEVGLQEPAGSPPDVVGNLELLTWLLAEVFTNARKFGGPDAVVTIGTSTNRGYVDLRITNTGRVIDADLAEDAFKLGRMLQARGERPGVGMGLPLVRRIATRHGGHVAFVPAGATTLDLTLLGGHLPLETAETGSDRA